MHKIIHIVPHSHNDLGWLKTVDEYYTGRGIGSLYTDGNVKKELTSIIESLSKNVDRKFTWANIKYFSMWWSEQSEEMKELTRMLVQRKQLEFVGGGWSMHDEACPTFDIMIDNMMIGHKFLMDEFGVWTSLDADILNILLVAFNYRVFLVLP